MPDPTPPPEWPIEVGRPDAVVVVRPGDKIVMVWPKATPEQLKAVELWLDHHTQGWNVDIAHIAGPDKILHYPREPQ